MAITVTWSVLDMKRDAATGGVKEVRWQCKAEADSGQTAVEAGKLLLEPDADAEDFIAYADLTEEIVLGWVKAQDGFDATAIEENRRGKVQGQIDRAAADATGLPWSTEEPAE